MADWESPPIKKGYYTEYRYRPHKGNITYILNKWDWCYIYRFYRKGQGWYQIEGRVPKEKDKHNTHPWHEWIIRGGEVNGQYLGPAVIFGLPRTVEEIDLINSYRTPHKECSYIPTRHPYNDLWKKRRDIKKARQHIRWMNYKQQYLYHYESKSKWWRKLKAIWHIIRDD